MLPFPPVETTSFLLLRQPVRNSASALLAIFTEKYDHSADLYQAIVGMDQQF